MISEERSTQQSDFPKLEPGKPGIFFERVGPYPCFCINDIYLELFAGSKTKAGASVDSALICFPRNPHIIKKDKELLAFLLPQALFEKIKSTTCLESCIGIVKLIIVKKEYRGHGFQIKILKKFDDFYKKFGIKRVICSVSPLNFFSLNNFYSNGFYLIYRKNLYDGYDRLILAKNVK